MSAFLFYFCSVFCVICALLPGTVRAEPKCHLSEVERCFDKLHTLKDANNDPSYLLTSTDGLDRICRVLKVDYVDCITGFIQKCGTPLNKELSKVIFDAVLQHMDQICTPSSPFRNEIVAVGPCLHEKVLSQKPFQRECNNPLYTTIAWGEMNAHSEHHDNNVLDYIIDSGCCAYRLWEECSVPKIVDQCQDNGQQVLQTVMSKLLGGLPDFICSKELFAPSSKICTSMPQLEVQRSQVNFTAHEEQKFSIFSLVKMFLTRDATSR